MQRYAPRPRPVSGEQGPGEGQSLRGAERRSNPGVSAAIIEHLLLDCFASLAMTALRAALRCPWHEVLTLVLVVSGSGACGPYSRGGSRNCRSLRLTPGESAGTEEGSEAPQIKCSPS